MKIKFRPIPECQQSIEERVQVLQDTFGENEARVRKVTSRVSEMTADGTQASWHVAALYAAWATQNPGEITREPTYECICGAGKGWVAELDETGQIDTMRPCSRCNQERFSWLYEKGNRYPDDATKRRSAVESDEMPPPQDRTWDDM